MINPFDDGGPAFPHLVAKGKFTDVDPVAGMTLRDYFAGQVLTVASEDHGPIGAAAMAYCYADAMLKAREATT